LHDLREAYPEGSGYVYNPQSVGFNQPPNNQGPLFDTLFVCPDPVGALLDRMPCSEFGGDLFVGYLSAAPRSYHPNGVNVGFMDGHIGFISNGIDPLTMAHLIGIEDRVPIFLNDHVH
jgi:prepilin-type processing-associated H-X9-DG protein